METTCWRSPPGEFPTNLTSATSFSDPSLVCPDTGLYQGNRRRCCRGKTLLDVIDIIEPPTCASDGKSPQLLFWMFAGLAVSERWQLIVSRPVSSRLARLSPPPQQRFHRSEIYWDDHKQLELGLNQVYPHETSPLTLRTTPPRRPLLSTSRSSFSTTWSNRSWLCPCVGLSHCSHSLQVSELGGKADRRAKSL